MEGFSYLGAGEVYLDTACQSLRPEVVLAKVEEYYREYNACGGRSKYAWAQTTDRLVEQTRAAILEWLKLSAREYFVSFTLNTTYGLNLIMSQVQTGRFARIITSETEHNSPFLASMVAAERLGIPRLVKPRREDGGVDLSEAELCDAIVVLGVASNVDGRQLANMQEIIKQTQRAGGIVILDAAQAMAHHSNLLHKTKADAICFSAHKMYAPSLGVMVVRRDLLAKLEVGMLGGGMVLDVHADNYEPNFTEKDHASARFELGLQAWGEIIGLGAAINWLNQRNRSDYARLEKISHELYDLLATHPRVHLVNRTPSTALSFYVEGIDSHLLGMALGQEQIMVRTGYFCVHYYLDHVLHLPPLVRMSLGFHNRLEDIVKVKQVLEKI